MDWKSLAGLVIAFFAVFFVAVLGGAGVAPLEVNSLTAKEINHRTLKAAAAIDRLHRRYRGAVTTTGPSAELKVPLTKELMETNAGQIALFKNASFKNRVGSSVT